MAGLLRIYNTMRFDSIFYFTMCVTGVKGGWGLVGWGLSDGPNPSQHLSIAPCCMMTVIFQFNVQL